MESFETVLSRQVHLGSEAIGTTFQCSPVAGELSDVQSTVLAAIIDSLYYWAIHGHSNAYKLRRNTANHVHMTQLL